MTQLINQPIRPIPARGIPVEFTCKHCSQVFSLKPARIHEGRGTFCSQTCQLAHRTATSMGFKKQRGLIRERNRAFITDLNARTVCAHCSKQPIEWHNPEHVLLGRQLHRIGKLVASTSSISTIQAEIDRCTPLCRRCHMIEDGRMRQFMVHALLPKAQPPKPCAECDRLYKPLRRGLCDPCYGRQLKQQRGNA